MGTCFSPEQYNLSRFTETEKAVFQLNCYTGRLKPGADPAQPCRWKGKVYSCLKAEAEESKAKSWSPALEDSDYSFPSTHSFILEAICMPQQILYHHYRYDCCVPVRVRLYVKRSPCRRLSLSVVMLCVPGSPSHGLPGAPCLHLPPQHRSMGITGPLSSSQLIWVLGT